MGFAEKAPVVMTIESLCYRYRCSEKILKTL